MADISLIIDTNADEAARDIDKLINSTSTLGNTMQGTAKDTQMLSKAQQNSGNVARTAGRKMSGTGMAIQQVGYQTGDFLVQIQGGTNAMVAFGQQATQLVGVLPMVASNLGLSMGAAIGLSASLGIIIPLVTAVGAYFMRSGGEAQTFEDAIESLSDAVDNYASVMEYANNVTAGARKEFGYTSGILQVLVKDFQTLARIDAFKGLDAATQMLRTDFISGFESDVENIKDLLGNTDWFGALSDEVTQFDSLLATVESNAYSLENRLASAFDLRDQLIKTANGVENLTDEQRGFLDALDETIVQMEGISAAMSGLEVNQQALVDGAESFLGMWVSIKGAIQEAVAGIPTMGTSVSGGRGVSPGADAEGINEYNFAAQLASLKINPTTTTSTSGGGSTQTDSRLQALITSLQTEQELLETWYSTQQDLVAQYNESELAVIGGQAEAKLRLEQEYSDKLVDLKNKESQLVQNSAKGMYNELGNFLSVFASKSKAAAIAQIALSKALSIAEAINNTAVAVTYALRSDPTGVLASRVAAMGKIQVGLIAATGLAQAASVAGSGGSGGSIGSAPSGSDVSVSSQSTATPQRVIIEGIDRDSLITGEQLSNIFEALYKENENRGFVFEVATG